MELPQTREEIHRSKNSAFTPIGPSRESISRNCSLKIDNCSSKSRESVGKDFMVVVQIYLEMNQNVTEICQGLENLIMGQPKMCKIR